MPAPRWDAVVVGAGPAGSATALQLARAGAKVLLLDRARFPRDKPCSEYLSPAATPLLERLDRSLVAEVERSAPGRLYGMRVVGPDGTTAVGRFAADHRFPSPRPYGFALPRRVLDTLLAQAAERAGATIEEGVQVEDLVYDQAAVGGVVARRAGRNGGGGGSGGLGRRHALRARVVVAADGLRSVVARRLGLRRAGLPRRIAWTAHFQGVAAVEDLGEMHIGERGRGYVGLGPIGSGVTTVALVLPAARAHDGAAALRNVDSLIAELDRFPGLAGRFAAAQLVRAVLVTGPFAQWSRSSVAPGGGALLVGDAADFFDPFTGQGLYSALRGAELVADAVLDGLAAGRGVLRSEALAPYARARGRTFAGKWVLERLIGFGVGWPWLAGPVVRRLARLPAVADLLVGATGNFVPARAVLAPSTLLRLLTLK